MRRVKGFTLIELLVVVAIIGGLIAILVPSLSKSRQLAKSVQCAANLRSMAQILNVYMDANGGQQKLPGQFMIRGILPDKTLICPQTQVVFFPDATPVHPGSAFTTWANPVPPTGVNRYGSYGSNNFYVLGFIGPGYYNRTTPINEGIIPAFVDAANEQVVADESNCIPISGNYTPASQLGATAMRRHGGGVNVGFADGHVEGVKVEDLWTLRWKANWKRFDPYPVPASWNGLDPS